MTFENGPWGDPGADLAAMARGVAERGRPFTGVLEDREVTLRADGSVVERLWSITVVHDPHGLGIDGYSAVSWQTDREDRPVAEARVVLPDGTEHRVGSEQHQTVREVQIGAHVQRLEAVPLPGLVPGAVIERCSTRVRHALGPAGVRVAFPDEGRFRLHAHSEESAIVAAIRGSDIPLRVEGADAWLDTEVARTTSRRLAHPDTPSTPILAIAVTDDPARIADAWRALAPSEPAPEALAARVRDAADPVAEAHLIAAREVRFAVSGGAPRPHGAVGGDLFGDCREKSALLVALLRSAGVGASVALVAGSEPDGPAGPVSLRFYDHVLVRLDDGRWVDPSELRPIGSLHWALSGRTALVVDGPARGLHVLPPADATHDRLVMTRTYTPVLHGPTCAVETVEASGAPAFLYWIDPDDEEQIADRADGLEGGHAAGIEVHVDADRLRTRLVADDCDPFFEEGPLGIAFSPALQPLCGSFGYLGELLARTDEPVFLPPVHNRLEVRLDLPRGVRPVRLPAPVELAFGPVRISIRWSLEGDTTVCASSLDLGTGELDVAAARALGRWLGQSAPEVVLTWEPLERLDDGDALGAIDLAGSLVASAPRDAVLQGLLALTRARLGLRDAAITALRAAEVDDEGVREAWVAQVYALDPSGRVGTVGDPEGIVGALERAVALGNTAMSGRLAEAMSERGGAPGDDALEALYAEWEADGDPSTAWRIAEALVRAGRPDDALEFAEDEAPWLDGAPRIAAEAVVNGLDAGLAVAREVEDRKERGRALVEAWWLLVGIGRTDVARGLRGALIDLFGAGAQDMLEDARSLEELGPDEAPLTALAALVRAAIAKDPALVVATGRPVPPDFEGLANLAGRFGADAVVAALLGRARVVERSGDAALITTRVSVIEHTAVVVLEEGQWRWLADDGCPYPCAVAGVACADAGDAEGVLRWLRWEVELVEGIGFTGRGKVAASGPLAMMARMSGMGATTGPRTRMGETWKVLDRRRPEQIEAVVRTLAQYGGRVPIDWTGIPERLQALLGVFLFEAAYDRRDFEQAVVWARRRVELDPGDDETHYQLALALERAGDRDGAFAAIADLEACAPGAPHVLTRRMRAHAHFGEVDATLAVAAEVVDTFTPDERLFGTAGWYLLFGDDEQVEQGAEAIEAALEAGECTEADLHSAAVARLLLGEPVGAVAAMQDAAELRGLTLGAWDLVRSALAGWLGMAEVADALAAGFADDGPFSDGRILARLREAVPAYST
ncbi:MAG: hypothetical protein H6737_00945 [Alphaproteobacteria bacterium]|nr:hypothetical protein [Alphaproteobacteria bacterium]